MRNAIVVDELFDVLENFALNTTHQISQIKSKQTKRKYNKHQ